MADVVEDQRARLEALRDKLAAAIETCTENMLPQLAGQYRATLAELTALPPVVDGPVSLIDQLKDRRERKQDRGAETSEARPAASAGRKRGS